MTLVQLRALVINRVNSFVLSTLCCFLNSTLPMLNRLILFARVLALYLPSFTTVLKVHLKDHL